MCEVNSLLNTEFCLRHMVTGDSRICKKGLLSDIRQFVLFNNTPSVD